VFCADDRRLTDLLACRPGAVSYGFHPLAGYRLAPKVAAAGATEFEVWNQGEKLGDFSVQLFGEQNISNAGAVVALLHSLGFTPAAIAPAIAGFTGATRRQQELFRDARFQVFDDYGHHPAEIEVTLRAFKQRGARRLLVAFQPHRYSRTRFLLAQFATCFRVADQLWVTEVYAASESEIAGINGALLANAIRKAGQAVEFIASLADMRRAMRAAMQPGDVVLFLGAGDITRAAHDLANELMRETEVQLRRE
jgi:UDP-N-acetylmuramate--alanine ligase